MTLVDKKLKQYRSDIQLAKRRKNDEEVHRLIAERDEYKRGRPNQAAISADVIRSSTLAVQDRIQPKQRTSVSHSTAESLRVVTTHTRTTTMVKPLHCGVKRSRVEVDRHSHGQQATISQNEKVN